MNKLRIPISAKLIVITILLLLSVSIPVAYQSSKLFEEITIRRETLANMDSSATRATENEQLFVSYIDKIKIVSALLLKEDKTTQERDLQLTFRQDRDLVSIEVKSKLEGFKKIQVINEDYLKEYNLNKEYIEEIRKSQKAQNLFQEESVFAGKIEIRNASIEGGAPLLTIGIPLATNDLDEVTHIAIADINLSRLQKVFSKTSERSTFLVDDKGNLIAHADENLVMKKASFINLPIVETALKSDVRRQQKIYTKDSDSKKYIAAYAKTSMGLTVITEVPEEIILEGAKQVQREAIYITGRVLSIALFLIVLFSITITTPIEKLVEVTKRVALGNFDIKSNVKSRDEVGELSRAFDSMVNGLAERDKMKNVLNKFHGSKVAEDLIAGNLQLGGSKKNVTVFFSDIRDFTKFSEGHTPEEVVEMLNEYFHIMVGIINKNNGVVDKFIGDAIMAVWGAPTAHERDAQNALMSCLEMREALAILNEKRIARGQVPIKIGIGLHKGEAISGNIGSDERMEYTVIGDAVNQAARIEASTKAFGTDLLISDTLFELISDEFVIKEAGKVEVKGKSKPLTLFKVPGYIKDGEEIIIRTEYSDYDAGEDAKVKIAS
ncbi:MAG: HAMP domain-containing protein [Bdellovibrionaceae bacterium]|nr:HAMP domain-containing protein [Pseudobdellovibrionaceae bacterium]